MDFLELIKKRKSVRKYSDKKVDIGLVKELLKESQEAPTACNHQLYKFVVVTDDKIKKDIVRQSGSVDIIGYAPVSIVIMTQMGWNHNKGSYIQSLGAIAYNIQLSIENKGMSSVWMAGLGNTKKIQSILNIPDVYQVLAVISLGYEVENNVNDFKPPRYKIEDKIAINSFDFKDDLTFPMSIKDDKVIHCWDIDKWSLEQIDNWKGHAVYATSPTKMAYVGRNYTKDYEYEVDFFSKNITGTDVLFLLSSTGQYVSGVIEKEPNKNYTIHELSDKLFTFIQKRLQIVGKEKDDVEYIANMDFKFDKKYDTIIIGQALEFIPTKDRMKLLNNISQYLSDDGMILVSHLNKSSWYQLHWLKNIVPTQIQNKGIFTPIYSKEVKDNVKNLKRIDEKSITLLPKGKYKGKEIKNKFLSKFGAVKLYKYQKSENG